MSFSAGARAIKDLPFDIEPLIELCKSHDISLLGAFDAAAFEDEFGVDLFVRFSKNKSAALSVTLERHLSRIIEQEVHLVTEDSLTPHMRDRILKDIEVIYEA